MKRLKQLLLSSPEDDRGATLILVLFIVAFMGLAVAALLTFSDTSIRTTVALRDQASAAYAADGAAQVAVKQLLADNFNGVAGGCDTTHTKIWNNFYPSNNGTPLTSVAVKCTPDPSNTGSGVGANSSPGSALLSLGTGQGGEDGIWDGSVNNRTFKVSGGIFSNSNINLGDKSSGTGAAGNVKSVIQNLSTDSYVFATGAISGPGNIIVTGTTTVTPNYPNTDGLDRRGLDPQTVFGHGLSFDPPTALSSAPLVPPCTGKKVYDLDPGLYTSAASLNALTASGNSGPCAGSIVHFKPGTYFFNFQDAAVAHKWTTNAAWVVAGTTPIGTTLNVASPPAMTPATPSCVVPGPLPATTSSGVEFVFGGDSRMDYTSAGTSTANIEICASNATSGPPVAIYALKSAIGSMQGSSGCLVATPYVAGGDSSHCALIQSYADPTPSFTVHGTVYVPWAPIDIVFNSSAAQYFQWGLVARTILVSSTGSATAMDNATISVPNTAPAPFALPNIMYLDVYVCPGSSTCDDTGTVRLKAKVQLSTTTPKTATVLGWAVQR